MGRFKVGFTALTWLSVCAAAPALDPIAILSPSDVPAGYGNAFGSSVAISGDYLVIGAPRDPWYNGDATGAVYVFRRQGRAWVEQAKLTAPDTGWEYQLGYSVAIDGGVIVAGAPRWEFSACGFGGGPGAAYVFRRDGNGTPDDPTDDTWSQEAKLTLDPQLPQRLGMSVAISGDVIVVGTECGGTTEKTTEGSAEVFRWNPGAPEPWVHEASLTGSKMQGRYGFGLSLDVDGDRIVAGSYWNDDGPGVAYVFVRNGTAWVEEDILTPSDHTTPDSFGWSVSISSGSVVVGAVGTNEAGSHSGSAYVFARDYSDMWVEQAKLIAPDGAAHDEFGYSVGIDGELVLVGKPGDPLGNAANNFMAYLFDCDGSQCTKVDTLVSFDALAPRVGIDGKYAIVLDQVFAVREHRSLTDFARFQTCFTASSAQGLSPTCQPFDLTGDGRVDLSDFEDLVGTFVGP